MKENFVIIDESSSNHDSSMFKGSVKEDEKNTSSQMQNLTVSKFNFQRDDLSKLQKHYK